MEFTVLEARRYSASGGKAPERRVKDYEIDVECADGRLYTYLEKEYKLARGDVLVRTPGDTVSSVGAQTSYIVTLDFSTRERAGAYSRNIMGEEQPPTENTLVTALPPIIHPRDRGAVLEIYRTLVNLPDRNSAAAKELVREIIYLLNAECAHASYEKHKPPESAVDAAVRYMSKRLGERVTLSELSALVHLEKSYFVRLFREQTGKTPIEKLVEMRLDRADDLLAATDMKIFEIAEAVGYNTTSFFILEYKKRFGITPEAHRRSILSKK